jgi:hypothetical protein
MVCIVLGPFTCFTTWMLAYYVYLVGLPIHLLALVVGIAGQSRHSLPGKDRGSMFALTTGLLGTLLSGIVLAGVYAFVGGLPWVN